MRIPMVTAVIPSVDTKQMIEVDRVMIEDYRIDLVQMMENAGSSLAHLARERFLDGDPRGKSVVVLAGTGGNGGGALVCSRRLHNYGADVNVLVTKPDEEFAPVPRRQIGILRRMSVPVTVAWAKVDLDTPDLIIDGLIGYNLQGRPRGSAATLIRWANEQQTPTLALDVPSGLDTTTGKAYEPTIAATATMTLALPKTGMLSESAKSQVGEIYLADISVPPELYAGPTLQIDVGPIFATSDVIRLR